jgi:hypothetical protein
MRTRWPGSLVFLSSLLVACSGSQPSNQDGGLDAWDAGDHDAGGDLPTGRPRLIVETGAVACAVFDEGARDWRGELALLGRIDFLPQAMALPTDESVWELDLVEGLLFGPEAVAAVSQGTGTMVHEILYEGEVRVDHYTYTHLFDVQGEDLSLEANLYFGPDCDEIRFTDDFLGTARNPCVREPYFHFFYSQQLFDLHAWLGDGSDPETQKQTYSSCLHRESPLYEIEAVTGDQDRIRLDKRYYTQTFASGPASLVRARVTLGGVNRETDDYFSLVYSAVHHNWREEYLVLLDPPIGEIHGVVIERENQEAVYLDADLAEQTRKTLVEYTGDSAGF